MYFLYVGYCDWPWIEVRTCDDLDRWSYYYLMVRIWLDVAYCLCETLISWWLDDGYTDNIKTRVDRQEWDDWLLIYWGDGLPYQILWHGLMLDVHDGYWDYKLMYQLLLNAVQVDEVLISSIWDCISIRRYMTCYWTTLCYWNYWENIVRP